MRLKSAYRGDSPNDAFSGSCDGVFDRLAILGDEQCLLVRFGRDSGWINEA
jgi:hypothetical protein